MTIAAAQQKTPARAIIEPAYVFGTRVNGGSNDATATFAVRFHGAGADVWTGPTGNAYALPCRNSEGAALSARIFGNYLTAFFSFAADHPEQRFRISRFGCEKDGFSDADMARLWRNAPPNCVLPAVWQRELNGPELARILIFDPLVRLKSAAWRRILKRYLMVNLPLWGATRCEFLSSGGPRDSRCTVDAARELGYPHREVRADRLHYKEQCDVVSDMFAIWSATHLLSITDPDQTSVPSHVRMLNYAMRDGLFVDDLSMDDLDTDQS